MPETESIDRRGPGGAPLHRGRDCRRLSVALSVGDGLVKYFIRSAPHSGLLVINDRTAKAMGLTIPAALALRADQILE